MRVNHAYLYWGVFLLTLGGAVVVVDLVNPDPTALADVLQYWPLIVVAIGIALVLRRTRLNVAGGMLAAAVPGLILGSAIAVGPRAGWDCAPRDEAYQTVATEQGTFIGSASVDVAIGCGTLTITTSPGRGWDVVAGNSDGHAPVVDATTDGLSLRSALKDRWFGFHGRDAWQMTLPTSRLETLDVEVNAGEGRTDLAGADIGALTVITNAGRSTVDLATANVETLAANVNAGSLALDLPAADDVQGSISVNAGDAEVCVPDSIGLRVRSSGALSSTELNGLVQRDGAWESPDYASAAHHADLSVSVNLGSLRINPVGGCS